jgi:polyphosphate glucokinase
VNVLTIDIGGNHVKVLVTGQNQPREFESGPTLTPERMVAGVKRVGLGWTYEVISMGYPGVVLHGRPIEEPHNLGRGWVSFDYQAAFGRPVRIISDAAMQALGSYRGGKMLFLGFGTGLGSTLIADGVVEPMELGHLRYKKGTYEDYVGQRGLDKRGKKEWRRYVADVVARLAAALRGPDGDAPMRVESLADAESVARAGAAFTAAEGRGRGGAGSLHCGLQRRADPIADAVFPD